MVESLPNLKAESIPVTFAAYGDENAIRSVSASGGADITSAMVVAAIAIPNLLRARIAANEASAVGMLRTVNTAEITYASAYPEKGYARDLASLGPDPRGANLYSSQHAALIDETLGNASCTLGTWCSKSGYRFNLAAVCKQHACKEYVFVSTPVSSGTGTRNFCSVSDGVIRFQLAPPLTSPISVSECLKWAPVQ
jgi:hypothetical protein